MLTGPVGGGGGGLPGEGSSGGREGGLGGVVNTHNGNYMKDVPLFDFPCKGGRLEVDFTLYHNSIGDYIGGFGFGWSFTYDAVLSVESGQIQGSEIITIRWGDGTVVVFDDSNADGVYIRQPGVFDNLIKLPGGNYQVTTQDHVKIEFAKPSSSITFRILTIKDRNNNTITVAWDTLGKITGITDPTGRQTIITYDGERVDTVTDPAGRVWSFVYDAIWNQDLIKIDYPALSGVIHTSFFEFDGDHNILSFKDLKGKEWTLEYADGKISKIIEPEPISRTTEYIYSTSYTDIKNSDNTTIRHNYGLDELLVSEVDEAGYSVGYLMYNIDHLPTKIKDKRGKFWTRTFDTNGNMLTEKNPLNNTWTYTYTAKSDVDTAKNPYNETWNFDYDANGNLEYVYDPSLPAKRLVYNHYDSAGQIDWTKDAYNNLTTFGYDSHGNLDLVTDPYLKETTGDYDVLGRLEWVKDPLLHQTKLHYDEWGRMEWLEHPAVSGVVHSIFYEFDNLGNVTRATSERGKETNLVYDEVGRLLTATNARNEVETYQYNAGASCGRSRTEGTTRGSTSTTSEVSRTRYPCLTAPARDGLTTETATPPTTTTASFCSKLPAPYSTTPTG